MSTAVAAAPATFDPVLLDDPLELEQCTRWELDRQGRRRAVSHLQLSGMYCAACAGLIEQALHRVPGVERASVVSATQRATVHWNPERARMSSMVAAVRQAGYDAAPDAAAPGRELRRRELRNALWRWFVAAFCAMQVMMLATPSYVAAEGDLAPDLRALLNWGAWVLSLPVMGFSAGPYFASAWQQLRRRRIGMDTPVALALLVTFIASTGATFDPSGLFGHEVYFDSLTMFLAFILGGRLLELRARHRAADDLEQALARMPEHCERQTSAGGWEQVSVRRLAPGDVVRVAAGQAVPADGQVLEGQARVDESLLTGESDPRHRPPGSAVVAASINVGPPIVMRVERVGADTRYEGIVAMMREAMSQRPDLARTADRWAGPFLWGVLALAFTGALAWSWIDPQRSIWVFVAVLIVTCPCAFSLAAPAALVAAAAALARQGVVFKRLEAIEALAQANHLCVDKTGTLTEERLVLADMLMLGPPELPKDALLRTAASLAAWSTHPVSRALADRAGPDEAGMHWSAINEVVGAGLEASDAEGRNWRLGSRAWACGDDAIVSPQARAWLSCEGRVMAAFTFDEALRPQAAESIAELRRMGLKASLLSGDSAPRANAVAARLGIDEVLAQATPQAKLDRLAQLQTAGAKVWMVGDGVNDAPVLARADVAFAMGQGALVSRTHADAVVASNRPGDLVLARRVATRSMRIVRQNLVWAAIYNAACIPLALMGWLPPWAAGLGMALSSLGVIANAARAGHSSS